MTKKKSLSLKFIVGFVVVGLILSLLVLYFGYNGYKDSMEHQYHDTAYLIADTAEQIILDTATIEELEEFVEIAKSGDEEQIEYVESLGRYEKIHDDLDNLRKNMKLTDIYVTWYDPEVLRNYSEGDPDWKPLLYIFDCYYNDEESYGLGTTSSMNPKNRELFAEVVENKTIQDEFIISNGDFGYNISALKPLLSRNGEVVAVIAVEEPMRLVEQSTKDFVVKTILAILGAMIITIVIFVIYIYRVVIKPVDLIAKEAVRFGEENAITEASDKLLSSIRTGDEIEVLSQSIGKMERDMLDFVDNIKKITAEKERIGAELDVATKIQADMLPRIFPPFPDRNDMDIYASMNPAKEVGGDFYDFFMVDNDHLGLVMADGSGKGVPAALFMVIAKTLIKNNMQADKVVEQVLIDSNNQLAENNDELLFVTAWVAIVDLKTGDVEYSDAGHEFALVLHPDGTVEEIHPAEKRMPLAAMEGMSYLRDTFNLGVGDKLFLYTDGVPEATNANNELYGMERLEAVLAKHTGDTPQEILTAVRADVDAFVGDAPQFDDLTMLAFERKI